MSTPSQKLKFSTLPMVIIAMMILYFFYDQFFSSPPDPPDDCEIPKMLHRCETEETKKLASFENELLLAANSDLKVLKTKEEISNLTNIKSLFEEKSNREYCVSEAFFETYQSKRNAICSYLTLLKDPDLVMSPEGRQQAEQNLVNIISELSKIVVEKPKEVIDSTNLRTQIREKIDATKGKCFQLEEDAKRVGQSNKIRSGALLDNCQLIIQFMESNIQQLQNGDIDEAYFWKRQKELEDKIDGYKVEMKALLSNN